MTDEPAFLSYRVIRTASTAAKLKNWAVTSRPRARNLAAITPVRVRFPGATSDRACLLVKATCHPSKSTLARGRVRFWETKESSPPPLTPHSTEKARERERERERERPEQRRPKRAVLSTSLFYCTTLSLFSTRGSVRPLLAAAP